MAAQAIAERIKEHRQALGLGQEAFAELLGVTRQTVSNWERARTIPDALMLKRIAAACGTTADALLGDKAPRIYDRALATRREFVVVCAIVFTTQFISMLIDGLSLGGPQAFDDRAFAAFRFGILLIGCVWMLIIARRAGLTTIRQMLDFASLASRHPGSTGDRLLRFVGRWFWTLWFVIAAAMYALGILIGMTRGTTETSMLIAPAFMLLVAAVPFTWERHAERPPRS